MSQSYYFVVNATAFLIIFMIAAVFAFRWLHNKFTGYSRMLNDYGAIMQFIFQCDDVDVLAIAVHRITAFEKRHIGKTDKAMHENYAIFLHMMVEHRADYLRMVARSNAIKNYTGMPGMVTDEGSFGHATDALRKGINQANGGYISKDEGIFSNAADDAIERQANLIKKYLTETGRIGIIK